MAAQTQLPQLREVTTTHPIIRVTMELMTQQILEPAGLPPMTTEPITLKYMNFDSEVLTQKLAEKFEEMYPNINVKWNTLMLLTSVLHY